jgi:hypothetical protein
VENAAAVHEVKALVETVERERVHQPILDPRVEQARDRAKALPARQPFDRWRILRVPKTRFGV